MSMLRHVFLTVLNLVLVDHAYKQCFAFMAEAAFRVDQGCCVMHGGNNLLRDFIRMAGDHLHTYGVPAALQDSVRGIGGQRAVDNAQNNGLNAEIIYEITDARHRGIQHKGDMRQ